MIKDKKFYRKRSLILLFVYSLTILTLGTCTYASLAWFTPKRTADLNFSSITVGEGFSVKVKYLSYNAQTDGGKTYFHGYKRSDITTLDSSFSYTSNFLDTDTYETLDPLGNAYFAPLYASTYCFEITYEGDETSFGISLSSFSAPASTTEFSDSLSDYISLSEAIDVFTAYSDGTDLDAEAKAFLEATSGDAAVDRFSHTGVSLPEDQYDSWNPASTMTLARGGTGYFFVTEFFSNDSSTFYSPVEGSANHWIHDTNGTSNPYQGLSIVLLGVSLDRI